MMIDDKGSGMFENKEEEKLEGNELKAGSC